MKINIDGILEGLIIVFFLMVIGVVINMKLELNAIEREWKENKEIIHFISE